MPFLGTGLLGANGFPTAKQKVHGGKLRETFCGLVREPFVVLGDVMVGRRRVYAVAGKDVLDCLLVLGCEADFSPQCPVVPALPQGGYDLLLDLLCRGMGKGVKHSLYAPGQLDGLVAAEVGARRSLLGIAGWVDNRQEGLVRGPLLVGEMPQALRGGDLS